MRQLLKKEFTLSVHPTSYLFLALSAMVLIPNYPLLIISFYTSLAVFFMCLSGRENHDYNFVMMLPVQRKEVVGARILTTVILEASQLLLMIPFAYLRSILGMGPNLAGMDANISLFGLSLILLGVFNLCFFTRYFSNVLKVGNAFGIASVAVTLFILISETLVHIPGLFKDVLDTPDFQYLGAKLLLLAIGAAVYAIMTALAYRISVKKFAALDL